MISYITNSIVVFIFHAFTGGSLLGCIVHNANIYQIVLMLKKCFILSKHILPTNLTTEINGSTLWFLTLLELFIDRDQSMSIISYNQDLQIGWVRFCSLDRAKSSPIQFSGFQGAGGNSMLIHHRN